MLCLMAQDETSQQVFTCSLTESLCHSLVDGHLQCALSVKLEALKAFLILPNKQLTAYALFDGSRRDKPAGLCSICNVEDIVVVKAQQLGSNRFVLDAIVLLCKDTAI